VRLASLGDVDVAATWLVPFMNDIGSFLGEVAVQSCVLFWRQPVLERRFRRPLLMSRQLRPIEIARRESA
jgi:hypothetical protein